MSIQQNYSPVAPTLFPQPASENMPLRDLEISQTIHERLERLAEAADQLGRCVQGKNYKPPVRRQADWVHVQPIDLKPSIPANELMENNSHAQAAPKKPWWHFKIRNI